MLEATENLALPGTSPALGTIPKTVTELQEYAISDLITEALDRLTSKDDDEGNESQQDTEQDGK